MPSRTTSSKSNSRRLRKRLQGPQSPDFSETRKFYNRQFELLRDRAGARGFLLKSDAGRDLIAAVEALQQQRTFFTTRVSQILDGYLGRENYRGDNADELNDVLTTREREVIQLLDRGKDQRGSRANP